MKYIIWLMLTGCVLGALFFLVSSIEDTSAEATTSAVAAAGLGIPSGANIPDSGPPNPDAAYIRGRTNYCDSIGYGITTSNPSTTSAFNEAINTLIDAGYDADVPNPNGCVSGATSWLSLGAGLFSPNVGWLSPPAANVVWLEDGSNDLVCSSFLGGWFHNYGFYGPSAICVTLVDGGPAVYRTDAGGTSGATQPAWTGGTVSDGTISDWMPSTTAQLETDLKHNTLIAADWFNNVSHPWQIEVATILPRGAGFVLPQTAAGFEAMRQDYNMWLIAQVGTHGIKGVERRDLDPVMGQTGQSANTTYYTDNIHPNDLGQHWLMQYHTLPTLKCILDGWCPSPYAGY